MKFLNLVLKNSCTKEDSAGNSTAYSYWNMMRAGEPRVENIGQLVDIHHHRENLRTKSPQKIGENKIRWCGNELVARRVGREGRISPTQWQQKMNRHEPIYFYLDREIQPLCSGVLFGPTKIKIAISMEIGKITNIMAFLHRMTILCAHKKGDAIFLKVTQYSYAI